MLLFTLAVTIGALTNVQLIQVSKASPDAKLYVDPAKSSAKKDGTFTIKINVADVHDLFSMSVYLVWDPTILNYNYRGPYDSKPGGDPDVVTGPFFEDYVASTPETDQVFLVVKSDQTEGWLDIATGMLGALTGVPGPTGGTTLLITFRVMQAGSTVIDVLSSGMLDHYPAAIPHTVTNDGYYRPGDLAGPGGVASDGVVNIWDLVYVALGYGKTVSQLKDPTSNTATYGGGWVTPTNAYTSNDIYATSSTPNQATAYHGYGFDTAQMNVIKKVLVGVEIKQPPEPVPETPAPEWVYIYVSNDGGVSYATYKFKLTPETSETLMWADMTPAFAWTPSMLTDALFRVKIEYKKYGVDANLVSLDWIPVKVEYTQTAAFTNPEIDISGNGAIDATDLALVAQAYGS